MAQAAGAISQRKLKKKKKKMNCIVMWNYSDETFLNATRGIKAMLADL